MVTWEFQSGVKDVITIFHAPSSSVSIRAHTILKQAAANAQTTATVDQAGEHGSESKTERTDFELGAYMNIDPLLQETVCMGGG